MNEISHRTRGQAFRPTKVAHVSSAHPWTDNRIHLREAATLATAGYDVTLIAIENDMVVPETGVKVIKMRKYSRLRRVTFGSLKAFCQGLRSKSEVFHFHDPEMVWAIPILRLAGKKVIYDAHEDLPAQIVNKHYVNRFQRPFFLAVAHVVVRVSKLSNHTIAATEKIAERYKAGSVSVVHNYPRLRECDLTIGAAAERGLSAVYVGGMGTERGAIQMIDALAEPSFPAGWTLEIAGTFAEASLLERLRRLPGWSRVKFHGKISPDGARNLIAKCGVGIVVFQGTEAHLDALPTKMFEYFAAGIPVIASDFPLWRSIVEVNQCGILVDESDPASIAAAIAKYAQDPELLARHGANARMVALSTLNWANEEPVLLDVYARVTNTHRAHVQNG
jgi:glycosyltransferase involved in cell wall biosynthesis